VAATGLTAGGTAAGLKAGAATGSGLIAAKTGAALTGWGLGASAGLGVGIVSSLIVAPLIALSQHIQNRNIMAAMAKIYEEPVTEPTTTEKAPEKKPEAEKAPKALSREEKLAAIPSASGLTPLINTIEQTVQHWARQLPDWIPLSNDASGLKRQFEEITGNPLQPHQKVAIEKAGNNWLPPLVSDLAHRPKDTIVRPDKAGVGAAHAIALAGPTLGAPISAIPWLVQKASEAIGFVFNPVSVPVHPVLQQALQWPAAIHPLSAPFNGLAGLIKSVTGGKVFLIPFLSTIGLKAGIVAGAVAAPVVAYTQHIRNRNIMAAWAESDKPAEGTAQKSTPHMLKLLKDNGPFKALVFDGRHNRPAANNINKAFNTTGIINP